MRLLPALLLLALPAAASAQEEGRRAWGRCGACHAVPDPERPADRTWIARIASSS